MKTIVIGDIHGRTVWKKIVNQYFDKFIFIGDYVDTHESITPNQQLENLLDIIEFKKRNPDKVILLWGNHDHHYLNVGERYSGFQSVMFPTFNYIYKQNIELFQMVHIQDNILFSHAGLSKVWCDNNDVIINENLEQQINELFYGRPSVFNFTGRDIYGDSHESNPIWIREKSLSESKIPGYVFVVGHTTKIQLAQRGFLISNHDGYKILDPNIWMIDTLGTSKEYLVIENNQFKVYKYE
jgi:predicted phosphodiesterase